jgi:predicted transcriptional regulator of viral defense system
MKTIELLDKLRKKPVFTIQDIERLASCSPDYAKQILNRLKKRELIKLITKNRYTTKDNIWVIASNLTYPCYISFWSASYFLGYTEQIVNTVQVATTRKLKTLKFEGYKIKFVPMKKYFFGYKKISTPEGEIFIAENEKLIIDAFLRPKELGNLDEIYKILENADISKDKMVGYLKQVKNNSVIKKAGFCLEKNRHLDLRRHFQLNNNYIVLNPFSKKSKQINSKWMVKI